MMLLLRKMLRFVECIPLISGLSECSSDDYGEALKELFSTLVIATSPIWLGAIVILIAKPGVKPPLIGAYWNIVLENVKKGELIIYCTTLLAPVFYLVLHDRKMEKAFPSRLSSIIVALVILFISGAIFAVQRAGLYFNPNAVFQVSVWLFFIAIFILYLAFVYNNSRFPNVAKVFRDNEKDFSNKFEKHRE